jgi:hypothetical protein
MANETPQHFGSPFEWNINSTKNEVRANVKEHDSISVELNPDEKWKVTGSGQIYESHKIR